MQIVRTALSHGGEGAARVRGALDSAGWREAGGTLRFVRGSAPGSVLGLSPDWWEASAAVVITALPDGERVDIFLTVRTTGQATTELERRYWEAKADWITATATSGGVAPRKSAALASAALRQNVMAVIVIVAGTYVAATAAGRRFDDLTAYLLGAAAGLFFTLSWAAWRLKLKFR